MVAREILRSETAAVGGQKSEQGLHLVHGREWTQDRAQPRVQAREEAALGCGGARGRGEDNSQRQSTIQSLPSPSIPPGAFGVAVTSHTHTTRVS